MSASNPDVVVVGMPSCGKTVFFTVLGKKLTNLVDGRRVAPLGFRMSTCDRETATVVNVAYDRLCRGIWPEATKAGQIMPLRWEVFTGRRRIFELYSMDIAGETFKKAFGVGDDDGDGTARPSRQSAKNDAGSGADSGDELYRDDFAQDDSDSSSASETEEEKAAYELKRAIASAKVVCFMVNIALPNAMDGRTLDRTEEKKLLRFRSSVLNMYLALRESRELRAKSMIVLTQTHLHEGEIERAGGPVMYLGDVCGGEAAELSNLARENDIPVMAVSAINEERDSNELPRITSPGDIPSSGLFGFLLAVSGKVARDDSLAKVRDAFLEYQRERVEYLKYPNQEVKVRFAQAIKCHDAAEEFVKACDRYLDNPDNLSEKGRTAALHPGSVAMYKRCTNEDPEVKAATDEEYLTRDRLWDRVLRRAVVLERQSGSAPRPKDIYSEMKAGMADVFHGREGGEEFVYGFGEEDLFPGSEASTFEKWIELNIKTYRAELECAIEELEELKRRVIADVDDLKSHVGKVDADDFDRRLPLVEKSHREFTRKMSEFRAKWLDDGNTDFPKINGIESEAVQKHNQVSEYKTEHERLKEKWLGEVDAAKRRHKVRATLATFFALGIFLSVLGGVMANAAQRHFNEKNNEIVQNISKAILRSDYAVAKRLHDSLLSIEWLGVDGSKLLCTNFPERLQRASDCHEAFEKVERLRSKLEGLRRWLNEVKVSSPKIDKIDEAAQQCDTALESCGKLPRSITFDDVVRQKMDFDSMITSANKCESSLMKSIGTVESLQAGFNELTRQAEFNEKMTEAEARMNEIDGEVASIGMESISNRMAQVNNCVGELQESTGTNDADMARFETFKKSADRTLDSLKNRYDKMRKVKADGMLNDVQAAMASNDVGQAWERYNAAHSSDLVERDRIRKLSEELLSFTLKECERELQEADKTVEFVSMQTAISIDMIDAMHKALNQVEHARATLRKIPRIPKEHEGFKRIESLANGVESKLPIIVQIDGVGEDGSYQPLTAKNVRNASTILTGVSPKSQKNCVYLLVLRNELPSGSSRLVKVVDADGRTHGMSIRLSDLAPGINRFEKTIN